MRCPPVQEVTIVPIATAARTLPNTVDTTVGIMAKNPPLPMPLMTTKAIRGPNEDDIGHRQSIPNVLTISVANKEFSRPILSPPKPQAMRPTADAKLKPATGAAPVYGE